MDSPVYLTFVYPILTISCVVGGVYLVLAVLARLFGFSRENQLCRLFASSPWLPLREGKMLDGEDVVFPLQNTKTTLPPVWLPGTWFASRTPAKGVILYCHEYNGNRYSAGTVVDRLRDNGFSVFSLDFRSDRSATSDESLQPAKSTSPLLLPSTPWVTTNDLADVRSALNYVVSRPDFPTNGKIGILGLSKGATVAAAVAGLEPRIQAVVLDSPAPEGRLFETTCWDAVAKRRRYLSTYLSFPYLMLLGKTAIFTLVCPLIFLIAKWRRFRFGFWSGQRFVNSWSCIKHLRQPVLIIHAGNDEYCKHDNIWAFYHRLRRSAGDGQPLLWIVPNAAHGCVARTVSEEYNDKLVQFFSHTLTGP